MLHTSNLLAPAGFKRFAGQKSASVQGFCFVTPEAVRKLVAEAGSVCVCARARVRACPRLVVCLCVLLLVNACVLVCVCLYLGVCGRACVCMRVCEGLFVFVVCARIDECLHVACMLSHMHHDDIYRQMKNEMVSAWVVTEVKARGRDGGGVRLAWCCCYCFSGLHISQCVMLRLEKARCCQTG